MEIVRNKTQHEALIDMRRLVLEVQELEMFGQVLACQCADMQYTPIMLLIECHVGLRRQTESLLLGTRDAQLDRHSECQLSSGK